MIYRVEEFRLDTDRELLTRGRTAVELRPKTRALLIHLVRHRHRLVPRQELLDVVWAGRRIEPQGVFQSVSELRAALGRPDAIRTVRGRGYQWVLPTEELQPSRTRFRPGAFASAAMIAAMAVVGALSFWLLIRVPADSTMADTLAAQPARLGAARAKMEAGQLDEAVRLFQDILNRNPDHFSARLDLAQIRHLQGNVESALAHARTVHSAAGLHGSLFERMGSALLISQITASSADAGFRLKYAREATELADRLGTPVVEGLAREQLGDIAARHGRTRDALDQLDQALHLIENECPSSTQRILAKIDMLGT